MQITDIITYAMIAAAVAYFIVRDVRAKKNGCACGCSRGCNCKCCNCACCNCGCSDGKRCCCGPTCNCDSTCTCGCQSRS